MELQNGRPGSTVGRLEKEIRVYDFLDQLGVSYQRIDHPPAMTMEDCAQVDQCLGASICKNLFLTNRQKTDFYLLMISGHKVFKTKMLSAQLGSSRLSFGSPEDMERYLDITPGSLSVLGLIHDTTCRVSLLVDQELLQGEYIGCHPCINTTSLRIRTQDLIQTVIPAMHHEMRLVSL